MKKSRVLLTSCGGPLSWAFQKDFQQRSDCQIFFGDANPQAPAKNWVKDFLPLLPAMDQDYGEHLLGLARHHDIDLIIPGADEEALALMSEQKRFKEAGIMLAVQDDSILSYFRSKSRMYDHLKSKGFPVPAYRTFTTPGELEAALKEFDYPRRPLLVKPNSGRGGRGIAIVAERIVPSKDDLHQFNRSLLEQWIDGKTEFLLMEYLAGDIFDIDVLTYAQGSVFFGMRRRLTNVTKLFSGNLFELNEQIDALAKSLYKIFPTRFLIDYDVMWTTDGKAVLLEVNPRPSGSTISYLPFGINLYYVLLKSYLCGEHQIPHNHFQGKKASVTFGIVAGENG